MTSDTASTRIVSLPSPVARPGRGAALFGVYVGAGLLLIAFNLRMGVAVGPVLPEIRQDLGGSSSAASLLTTIPVFAFGAFAFLTPVLVRRVGLHRLLGITMAAAAAGIGIRMIASPVALFGGTVVVGAAIAVGNVCMPTAIKHDFAHRTRLMMGLYTTALSIGPAVAIACTVPLMSAFGGSWRAALGFWALPAALAFVFWIPRAVRRPTHTSHTPPVTAPVADAAGEPRMKQLLHDRVAWAVTGYMGLQSLTYYVGLTWTSTLLQDAGTSAHDAGILTAYAAVPGVLASVLASTASRIRPAWLAVAASSLCGVLGFSGLLLSPTGGFAWLWMTLIGLAQGSAIALALGYIVQRSPDARHTGHLSTMAQGIGYLLAGFGPLGIGVLHSVSEGWTIPVLVLVLALLAQFAAGAAAARDRHVLAPRQRQEATSR